jgi:hypothetical protein
MFSSPGEVLTHHTVNPDFFEWLIFAGNLWIDSVQHWMEKWEDIEGCQSGFDLL